MMRASGLAVLAATLALAGGARAQSLTVLGLDRRTTVLDAATLADLPRSDVTVMIGDTPKTYAGPILTFVLRAAGAPMGARLHGAPLNAYLEVTGADGFQAVFSLAEVDEDFHDGTVILADRVDGEALPAKEAPWRLLASGDRKLWRSVFGVRSIELRMAGTGPATAPPADPAHAH